MTPARIEPATFQFVAQHLNHCATTVLLALKKICPFYTQYICLLLLILIVKVKVKVKCTLVQAVRPIGRVEVYLYSFLTTAQEGMKGQRHAPAALYPRERHSTHCIGGWMGPVAGLDGCGKSRLPPGFDPRTVQPVASRYTDYATLPTILVVISEYFLTQYEVVGLHNGNTSCPC